MSRSEPLYLAVGHVNKPHGTKGELFVWPLTDHPESTFAPGVVLYLADESGTAPDRTTPSLSVEGARPFRRGVLVHLAGIEDRDQASLLGGRYLLRPRDEVEPLEEGEVFYHQLLGMRVVTVEGEEVGSVLEVYELRPADLLEVRGRRGTIFIPFLKSVIQEVRVEEGTLVIDPPEGLLEL